MIPPEFTLDTSEFGTPLPDGTEVLIFQVNANDPSRARVVKTDGTCLYELWLIDHSLGVSARLFPSGEGIFWARGWEGVAELRAARALYVPPR